jgi:hypothetical protein
MRPDRRIIFEVVAAGFEVRAEKLTAGLTRERQLEGFEAVEVDRGRYLIN